MERLSLLSELATQAAREIACERDQIIAEAIMHVTGEPVIDPQKYVGRLSRLVAPDGAETYVLDGDIGLVRFMPLEGRPKMTVETYSYLFTQRYEGPIPYDPPPPEPWPSDPSTRPSLSINAWERERGD